MDLAGKLLMNRSNLFVLLEQQVKDRSDVDFLVVEGDSCQYAEQQDSEDRKDDRQSELGIQGEGQAYDADGPWTYRNFLS